MSKKKSGGGSVVLFILLIIVGLLMFFGILTFKAEDMNDFFNLLRDLFSNARGGQ